MRRKIGSTLVLLTLLVLAMPMAALAQNRCDIRGQVRRDRNGIRFGDSRIGFLNGPGIVNLERRHRWMDGKAGAATVIGIGAGAGAATGGIVKGKKGAVIGALVGAGAATGVWLYKNRTERRSIF